MLARRGRRTPCGGGFGDDVHQATTVTPLHGASQPPDTAATARLRRLRAEVTQRDRPPGEPRPAGDHPGGHGVAMRTNPGRTGARIGANWCHHGRSALKGGSVNVVLYTALAFLPGAIFAVAAKALERWSRGERRSRGVTGAGSQPVGPPIERLVARPAPTRPGLLAHRGVGPSAPRTAVAERDPGLRRHPVRVLHRAGDPRARAAPVRPRPAAGDRGDPGAARSHLVAAGAAALPVARDVKKP